MPSSRYTFVMLALIAAFVASSCGSSESRRKPTTSVTFHVQRWSCGDAPATHAPRPVTSDSARGRVLLARAVAASRPGHRFEMRADLTLDTGLRASATGTGQRIANRRSNLAVRWTGASALILPSIDLRIAGDRIAVRRTHDRSARWRDAGSAAGIALDVGRELLDHPFLLRVGAPRRVGEFVEVDVEAPATGMRTYATTERRGIPTSLLARTRSLTMTVRLRNGRLVGDSFALDTGVDSELHRLPGMARARSIQIVARTGYCPLDVS